MHVLNGKNFLIKENFKKKDGTIIPNPPYTMSTVHEKYTEGCVSGKQQVIIKGTGASGFTRDNLLPSMFGKWDITLSNNLPTVTKTAERINIPKNVAGVMYLKAKVELCFQKDQQSKRKREVFTPAPTIRCCNKKNMILQKKSESEHTLACKMCPVGSKLSEDSTFCEGECPNNIEWHHRNCFIMRC